jgi:hypothetical protein
VQNLCLFHANTLFLPLTILASRLLALSEKGSLKTLQKKYLEIFLPTFSKIHEMRYTAFDGARVSRPTLKGAPSRHQEVTKMFKFWLMNIQPNLHIAATACCATLRSLSALEGTDGQKSGLAIATPDYRDSRS